MVLEYGEIDLAHMLSQKWKEMDGSNQTIDENWLRFYWQVLKLNLASNVIANYVYIDCSYIFSFFYSDYVMVYFVI